MTEAIRHAVKLGTKHKTACGVWLGKLPFGESVASRPSLANCPACVAAR